jgi:hypothetical protein
MSADRIKDAWRAAANVDPMIRYRAIYRARVLGQSGDLQAVSVRPYDSSLPPMTDIPLRHGVPGITVQVLPGCTVQIGWDDGRPDRPFAALWSADASALRVVLSAVSLELGSSNPTDSAIKGTMHFAHLATAFGAIATGLAATAAGLTKAGQPDAASAVTGAAAALASVTALLPTALSARVRVG